MVFVTLPIFTPLIDIYLVSVLTSIILRLLEKYFFKIRLTEEEKKELKEIKKKLKEYTKEKDIKNAQRMQKKIFEIQIRQMQKKFSLKIVLFRMIPYSMFLAFIRHHYSEFGNIFNYFGMHLTWFGSYVLFSIINSIIIMQIRKYYLKWEKKKEIGRLEIE